VHLGPLVCFGGFSDNTIKGLTSFSNVEQEVEYIAYTWGLYNEKCIKVQEESKLDGIPHCVQVKAKLCIVVLEYHGNNLVQAENNNANRIYEMTSMLWDIYHGIIWSKHIWQMANVTSEEWIWSYRWLVFTWTRRDWSYNGFGQVLKNKSRMHE
jgi:hypothetical protein